MSAPAKTPAVLQEGLSDVLRRGEELKGELHDKFAEGRDRKNVRGRLKNLFSQERTTIGLVITIISWLEIRSSSPHTKKQ